LLGIVVGWWVWLRPQQGVTTEPTTDVPILPSGTANAQHSDPDPGFDPKNSPNDEQNNIDVYRVVSPAVVNITSTVVQYDFFLQPVPSEGSGSGFVIDDKGHIVTNWHVVSGARTVEVTMSDQTKYPAELVGRDPQTDIAVIKIDAKKALPFVQLAGPDQR